MLAVFTLLFVHRTHIQLCNRPRANHVSFVPLLKAAVAREQPVVFLLGLHRCDKQCGEHRAHFVQQHYARVITGQLLSTRHSTIAHANCCFYKRVKNWLHFVRLVTINIVCVCSSNQGCCSSVRRRRVRNFSTFPSSTTLVVKSSKVKRVLSCHKRRATSVCKPVLLVSA